MNPVIIKKENVFCVYLPEWNVGAEGKTLDEAYSAFELKLTEMRQQSDKFGLATVSPDSYPKMRNQGLLREISVFFIKVGTATFAILLVAILLLPHIGAAVRSQISPIPEGRMKKIAVEIPTKINAKFDNLSPDEERELIKQWSKLWKRTEPYRKIFTDKN